LAWALESRAFGPKTIVLEKTSLKSGMCQKNLRSLKKKPNRAMSGDMAYKNMLFDSPFSYQEIKKTPYLIRYGARILKSESQKMRSALFRRCDGSQLWGRGGWHGLLGRSNHLRAWHDGFRDNWATCIAGGFSHNHVRNWCALVLMLAEQAVEQAAFRA
jgi:hypothetical protein